MRPRHTQRVKYSTYEKNDFVEVSKNLVRSENNFVWKNN